MCSRTLTVDRFLAAILCTFVLVNGCMAVDEHGGSAGNGTGGGGVSDGSGKKDDSTGLEEGLEPLYDMTSNFLDVIQPKSRGYILEIMGIDDLSTEGHEDDLKDSMEDDRDEWLDHYVGYVICVVVGAIYIVIIPIVGICFGLCRCCGNCGARQGTVKRQDKCKRIGCGLGLGLLNTVILAGVVCAFMTNELIRQQTAKDDDAYIPTIAGNLDKLKVFKDNSIAVYKSIDQGMQGKIEQAVQEAYAIPDTTKDLIGQQTNSAAVLDKADALANSVDAINRSLSYIYEYTQSLMDDGDTLTDDLAALKTNIENTLATCGTQECSDLEVEVDSLAAVADYSNVYNVEQQLLDIRTVIDGNLKGAIQQGRDEYNSITTDINADIETTLQGVRKEADIMIDVVSQAVDDGIGAVNEMNMTEFKLDLLDQQDDVEDYGNKWFYAGVGLSCIMLLVVLFNYLGLVFGILGGVPGEDARACNRSIGANLLLAGVAFTFIFGWLLMIGTVIMFVTGGVFNTEFCRYMLDPVESDATEYIDRVIANAFNESSDYNLNLRPTQVLRDCKADATVYTAFNLITVVNATEKLDLSTYGFQAKLNELAAVNVDLSGIDIISDDTTTKLEELRDTNLDGIDFDTFSAELDSELVTPDLTTLADQLDGAAADLPPGPTKQDLLDHAQELRDLNSGLVTQMAADEEKLSQHLEDLQEELYGAGGQTDSFTDKVDDLITEFETAEAALIDSGQTLIQYHVVNQSRYIYGKLNGFALLLEQAIRLQLAPCRDAYDALEDMIDATCLSVLEPVNGFWFSFGWCLIFGIPSLIFAIYLADLYRRTDDYSSKGLDEPNYDAYTRGYHGDNIPLEDDRKKLQLTGNRSPQYY